MNPPEPHRPTDCQHAAHAQSCPAQHTLSELKNKIRQQFAHAVSIEGMPLELADDILDNLDMAPLRRRWNVVVTVPIAVEVQAEDAQAADDTATALIENALIKSADVHELDVRWNDRLPEDVEPGSVDLDNP
ncbi:hypothetical protein R8Z50_22835 [Longispora sp. K20-0274]|uniref:hypothetical protein n=1 Tax=Longispora sp. K20-0274 TaxID=3088255 RepID=UPI00399BE381